MNSSMIAPRLAVALTTLTGLLALCGCASTADKSPASASTSEPGRKFKADDGRTIDIGKSTTADGGTRYDNPHMEKGKCWVADGFDFNGYDALYIAPTLSTAKFPDKPEDVTAHSFAKERLISEFVLKLNEHKIFANVVTNESDIKAGAKVLKLENTIIEFSKGSGGARFWAGEFGAGQPVLRIQGKMIRADKSVFTFEIRRSGTSAGARIGIMKGENIQTQDIQSMVLDLTDFMAAVARKYQPKG